MDAARLRSQLLLADPHRLGFVGAVFSIVVLSLDTALTESPGAGFWRLVIAVAVVSVGSYGVIRGLGPRSYWWWPTLQLATLAWCGVVAPQAAAVSSGMIALGFIYIGVSLPPWSFLVALVPASAVAWSVWDLPTSQSIARLFLAATVWVIVSELPARLINDLEHRRELLVIEGHRLRHDRDGLREVARTDPLTGLLNRRAWNEEALLVVDRYGQVAFAILDLDYFKTYNDTHGHAAGDRALEHFADHLRACVRDIDVVARWGGEEFSVALPDCDAATAEAIMRRVLESMPDGLSSSIGIAVATGGADPFEAMNRADAALYVAKHQGRAQIVVSDDPVVDA